MNRRGRMTEQYSTMITLELVRFFKANPAWRFKGSGIWNTATFTQLTYLWDHE